MQIPPTEARADAEERAGARSAVLCFLSLATTDPRAERWLRLADPELRAAACAAADLLARLPDAADVELAPGEGPPSELDLRSLLDHLDAPRERCVSAHDGVFGLVLSKECPPYETQYCPQTFSVYRSEQLADVAGFYRAFGLTPSRDAPERVDHVSLELELLAWLAAKELHALRTRGPESDATRVVREAGQAFLRDHLAWWLPAFARALREKARRALPAGSPEARFYAGLTRALASLVPLERVLAGVPVPDALAGPRPSEDAEQPEGCGGCSEGPA